MKYKLITKIGEGTYGVVYASYLPKENQGEPKRKKCKDEEENIEEKLRRILKPYTDRGDKIYAIKKVFNSSENMIRDTTLIELSCLNIFSSHPNIVKIHKEIFNDNNIFIVMDYYPRTLRDLFRLDFDERLRLFPKIAYQLCLILNHIHGLNLSHRDMKPMNILIDDDENVHLADWGLSKILDGQKDMDDVNTLWYRPPELLGGGSEKQYTCQQPDMWGLGISLLDFLNGYYIFEKVYSEEDIEEFSQNYIPISNVLDEETRSVIPLPIIEFINRLCDLDPSERLSSERALRFLEDNFKELQSEPNYPNIYEDYPSLYQGPLEKKYVEYMTKISSYKRYLSSNTINCFLNIYTHLAVSGKFDEKIKEMKDEYKEKEISCILTLLRGIMYFAGILSYQESLEDVIRKFGINIPKNKMIKDIFNMLDKNVLFGYTTF